jgi:hypothetical protein
MGVTGSGKSTFINQSANEQVKIGHSLHSSTAKVQIASFLTTDGRTGIIIDTPGFDDTNRSDTEILKEIATFLAKLYREGTRVTGLVYMHRITDVRMQGSAIKNLEVFRRLCGERCFPQVALVSTMWDTLRSPESVDMAEAREEELKRKPEYWRTMRASGARAFRYRNSEDSAKPIIRWLIDVPNRLTLSIQEEMVDRHIPLDKTAAGRYLVSDFTKLKTKYEDEIRALEIQIEEAQDEDEHQVERLLFAQRMDLKTKLVDTQESLEELSVDFDELARGMAPKYEAQIAQMEEEQMEEEQIVEVEEEDNLRTSAEIRKLQDEINALGEDQKLLLIQKEKEIKLRRRLDKAKANDEMERLSHFYSERERQLRIALRNEQQKRIEAEEKAEFERSRQQPRILEFMRRNFGREGQHIGIERETSDRPIIGASYSIARIDDRHAPVPPRRATTTTWQQPISTSRRATMMSSPQTRWATEERPFAAEPRDLNTERSRHDR